MIDTNNVEEVKAAIKKARKWAKKHFNSAQCHDTRLVDENLNFVHAFFVEFPDVDKMRVIPSVMGKPMFNGQLWFEYCLCFNPLQWEGKHPFYETPFPPLNVEEE